MEYFGHMGFGGIMWIVIVGLVFYLGFVLMRTGGDVRGSDSALEILKKRYAAGEISEEDFKRMKNELLGAEPSRNKECARGLNINRR
ncbi:MAG TPA: hypothetical protein ENJ15_05010, partial [Caldithrix abyssi]|nr:hypothetical protein [Caldithrix abyssi]